MEKNINIVGALKLRTSETRLNVRVCARTHTRTRDAVCMCLRVSRFASRTLSLYTFHYTSLNCRCYCCCHCWLLLLCCWWCWCCRGCCCYCCCSSPMFIQLALTSFVLIKCSTHFTSTVSRSLDSFIQRFAIKFNCVCFFCGSFQFSYYLSHQTIQPNRYGSFSL